MLANKIMRDISIGIMSFIACVEICAKLGEREENKENIVIDAQNETLVIKCKAEGIPYDNFKVFARNEKGKLYLHIKGVAFSDDMNIKTVSHKYRLKNIGIENLKEITCKIGNNDKLEVTVPITGYADKISVKKIKQG